MLNFTANALDGMSSGSCNTCCCEAFTLQPGGKQLVQINYMPWAGSIHGPGIMDGTEFNIETNTDACSTAEQDGFAPPTAANLALTTAVGTDLAVDLTTGVAPAANTFTYSIVPFSGPSRGTLTRTAEGQYTYSPTAGVSGYDYFSFEVTDAQGRSIIRHVSIDVGTHNEQLDFSRTALIPYVVRDEVYVDQRTQTLFVPIYMPTSVQSCESHRLTIRQPAQDCDRRTFYHLSCYDITRSACN